MELFCWQCSSISSLYLKAVKLLCSMCSHLKRVSSSCLQLWQLLPKCICFYKAVEIYCSSVRIAASTFVYKGVFLGCGLLLLNALFLPCVLFCGYSVITCILYIFVFCHWPLFQDYVLSVVRHISESRGEVRFNKDFIFVLLLHPVMQNSGCNIIMYYFNI